MKIMLIRWKEYSGFIGALSVLIGFILYGITSTYYLVHKQFNYYSQPSVWFIISIAIMVGGYYLWIQWFIKERQSEKEMERDD